MWWLLTFLIYLGGGEASNRACPLVNTKLGSIRGLWATDGDYYMIHDIPYATVNESNPFGLSLPYRRFKETFEAFDDSAVCPQVYEFTEKTGSLDCLHLNINVPNTATANNPLPVLAWIHGGGFIYGLGGRFVYGPKFFVRHDVILVTFNYRLGQYGFMCLDTPDVPGNEGLNDQLTVLRWVKNNIDVFGGDVNKITIFGKALGVVLRILHLLSKQEKLFNNVIIQSGSALSLLFVKETDTSVPLQLFKHLGLDTDKIDQALSFLSGIDSKIIISAVTDLNLNFKLAPCVEKEFEGVENFVLDYPINGQIPKAKSTPILAGITTDEDLEGYLLKSPEDF